MHYWNRLQPFFIFIYHTITLTLCYSCSAQNNSLNHNTQHSGLRGSCQLPGKIMLVHLQTTITECLVTNVYLGQSEAMSGATLNVNFLFIIHNNFLQSTNQCYNLYMYHATDNDQSYHKVDRILWPICTVAKADKAVLKDCGTVFGLHVNPHTISLLFNYARQLLFFSLSVIPYCIFQLLHTMILTWKATVLVQNSSSCLSEGNWYVPKNLQYKISS
jgi:hypothetical protein